MIDTGKYEGQIEFDDVLREIEVGVDISEGNYDILRYYRDEYKDLLAEVKRLQDALKEAVEVVKEMEGMAYAGADADKFANHALEFIGNVKEMIE